MSHSAGEREQQSEPALKCFLFFLVISALMTAAIVWSLARLAWAALGIVAAWDFFR